MNHKKEILKHYEPRLSTDREHYDILDWASTASQKSRFAVLTDTVELAGKKLLDVGCGLGDLYAHLRHLGIDLAYTGVDISDEMVQAARQLNAGVEFVCADLFADGDNTYPPGSFDVTFCSGALNLNLGNNLQFLPRAAAKLVELASGTAAFNLLHTRSSAREDRYFYYDPADVLKIAESLPCETEIIENYLPNDFTVICRKNS